MTIVINITVAERFIKGEGIRSGGGKYRSK